VARPSEKSLHNEKAFSESKDFSEDACETATMKDKQRAIILCAHHGISVTGSTDALKERLSTHLLKQEMAKEPPKLSCETFMNLTHPKPPEPKEPERKEKKEKKGKHALPSDGEKPPKKIRQLTAYQKFMRENRANVVASIGTGRPKEVMIELGVPPHEFEHNRRGNLLHRPTHPRCLFPHHNIPLPLQHRSSPLEGLQIGRPGSPSSDAQRR
jgi:hypothetical protein